jgi:hypothetical protein
LCAELIDADHGHVVDLESRALLCACRPCYLVFAPAGAGGRRFRAVPQRFVELSEMTLTAAQWEALQIPVEVAFFFVNSQLGKVAAFYPGPAGATESLLPLDSWSEFAGVEPDVEAVLVRNRDHLEGYIVPIDSCYELVGELRRLWKGFDGGSEAQDALDAFFDRVRTRAREQR